MNVLKNKYFIIGNILLLLAVIPLTLYIVKRQTDLKSKAAPNTVLSFSPNSASTTIGQTVSLDIMADPGQNLVSIVELTVKVDSDKFQIVSLERNSASFPGLLKGPTINNDGTANLSVTTTNDVTKALQVKTKVATLTLKAKTATNGAGSIVRFSPAPSTQAFSIAGADGATENVLSDTGTASITISGAAQISQNSKPICNSLTLDKANSGTAPYSLMFTGVGTASAGIISKATFNFGDATILDASSSAGGIGTNSVNVQMQHTYPNPGSFTATLVLTDNAGGVSDIGPCTQSITVASNVPVATESATPTPTLIVMAPTATATPSATPTLPITGTLETTLTILGIAGATIGIGLFLFAL